MASQRNLNPRSFQVSKDTCRCTSSASGRSGELYTRPILPPNGVLFGVLICLPVLGLVAMPGIWERRQLVNSSWNSGHLLVLSLSSAGRGLNFISIYTPCPSVEKEIPFAQHPLYARHFICIFYSILTRSLEVQLHRLPPFHRGGGETQVER